ncbi:DUF5916 domain-containing protein [Telmatobacter bradus]|uniref:carbohydrate binding family 9 domain-containing protein n=1 Tax=Telmatobacter bradus TaxID=474953 RepID=UPI003B431DA0
MSRAPRLEDFLLGRPREAEVAVATFTQFDPHDGTPASRPTTAYLSYDRLNLYVGWICKDDPTLIRARIAPRKKIDTDDRVTINIDTFQDRKHAYWFDVNPYGVQFDGRTTDGIGDDNSWEGLWYTEGRIVSDGYVVLETIPFRTLRFPHGRHQVWNIMLGRFIMRSNEMSFWPAMTHNRLPQFVGQFAPIEIDDDIVPGHNLQMIPYGLASSEHYLDPSSGFQQQYEHHPGLDGKMVLGGAFTLDGTLNPDFSEIGSDDPKVTVNQRYEVVYPESRTFFLENASAFLTPETLFLSRRIIDPQYGLKLTGSKDRWSLGALVANDRAPGETTTDGVYKSGDHAHDQLARIEHEFGSQQHVGLLLSNTSYESDYNRVASLDSRLLFAKNWAFKGQATTTQYRNKLSGYQAGPGYFASLIKNDNHLTFGSYYTDRSPGMVASLGYLDRNNIRTWEEYANYQWKPRHCALLAFGPGIDTQRIYDHNHILQNWLISPGFSFTLPRQTYIGLSNTYAYERYNNTDLSESLNSVVVDGSWSKWMELYSTYSWGRQPNYDAASPLSPFVGKYNYGYTTLTLYARHNLRMDNIYYYTRLAADQAQTRQSGSANSVVYTNHLIRSKINYQFTRDYSFRAILDYTANLPNAALITDNYAKIADSTLLFTYLPHPGTAIYLGYSNAFENISWDAEATPSFRRITDPSTSTDQQIFFKISHLFRF